jgi:hypothetical protein
MLGRPAQEVKAENRRRAPMIKGIFFDLGWTIFRPANDNWFINTIEELPELLILEVNHNE